MIYTVTTYDLRMFTSVMWYIDKLKNTNNKYLYLSECNHYDENDNKIIDFLCYDEEFVFTYHDVDIKYKRVKYGNPIFINSRCEAGNYEEILLDPNVSDKDEGISLMKDFFKECKDKYIENKKTKSVSEKMILWSYTDGFWDDVKRINTRKLDTVILNKDIKDDIELSLKQYSDPLHIKKLKSLGINNKMNLIFSGLPGTGKSSLLFAIATILEKDIATIDFNSKELTDHKFIKAIDKIPSECIFALEDIDALYIDRDKSRDNTVSFSCILNFLDGVYSKEDLVTIITTNHLSRLDKAIIRPMRINKIINFTYCTKYQYEVIFIKFFGDEYLNLMKEIYKIIKNKKFTTSMLQNWIIAFLFKPDELLDNIKLFEEIINTSSEKETNMFS